MTIYWDQILLLAAIAGFGLYVFRLRTVLIDRLIYLLLIAGGIALVLKPELSTNIANRIGIGRGTDLLFYIFMLFCLFQYVSVASQFKTLERQLTLLVRSTAIAHPILPATDIEGNEPEAR
jgi:hypothetical protein